MTDRLNLPLRYRRILEALLREHVPDAEVWAYGSCVTGESHDGCDLDLVVRGPELEPLGDGFFQLVEAIEDSYIPILVQTHDWARLPESFHREIERDYVVLQERTKDTSQGEWYHSVYGKLPSDFTEESLGALCVTNRGIQTGPFGSQLHQRDYVAVGTPIVTVEHLAENRIRHQDIPLVSDQDRDRLSKYILREGDIVFSRVGSVDRRALVRCTEDGWLFSGRCLRVRPDRQKIDPGYLSYFLGTPIFKEHVRSVAVGATMPSLNTQILSSLPIVFPPLPQQRAIAHVLGTLDDKIELNRRMNETLEEMARALFKSWFVDFLPVRAKQRARTQTGDPVRAKAALKTPPAGKSDWTVERASAYLDSMDKSVIDLFPDRLVDSELGEIPEGWEVGKLSDIVTRLTSNENPGLSPNTEFSHFSIPSYDEGQLPKRELGNEIKSSKSRVPQDVVLLSKLNPEIERVWLTDILPCERAICSTEFLVLRANPPFARSYVYCFARSPLFREQMKSLVTGTSKSHQRAPANAVLSIDTVLPTKEIAEAFGLTASRVLRRVLNNRQESRTLTALRDALLPKLVTGELGIG